jgi:hypothetical protein
MPGTIKINIPDNIWSVSIATVPRGREAEKVIMYYHVEAIDHRDAAARCLHLLGKASKYDRITITVMPFPVVPGLREFELFPIERGKIK